MYLHKSNPHGVLPRRSRVASTSRRPKCRLVRLLRKYRKDCFYVPPPRYWPWWWEFEGVLRSHSGIWASISQQHQFFLEREWSACAKSHGMMTPWHRAWSSWCTTMMPAICSDTCFYDFHKFNIHLFALALVFDRWRQELVLTRDYRFCLGWCRLKQSITTFVGISVCNWRKQIYDR